MPVTNINDGVNRMDDQVMMALALGESLGGHMRFALS